MNGLPRTGKTSTERVKQILLSAPPGTMGIEAVAESLFCSRRTLVRRLAKEGTTFSEIMVSILSDIAARHLTYTDDTVESVALLLNYYSSANFRRAFKKWYSMTPEQYRLLHRGSSDCA